jgi:hypothetical protein
MAFRDSESDKFSQQGMSWGIPVGRCLPCLMALSCQWSLMIQTSDRGSPFLFIPTCPSQFDENIKNRPSRETLPNGADQ